MSPDEAADLIPLDRVCELGRISKSGFRNLRQQGLVPDGYRIGRRLFFKPADVERWLNTRIKPVTPGRDR